MSDDSDNDRLWGARMAQHLREVGGEPNGQDRRHDLRAMLEEDPDVMPVPNADEPPVVFRHIADIVAEKREAEWLIDDVIERNVLAVLCGPRSTFKSFIALDWTLRIAQAGQCVLVLSGEGAGLDRRVDAWMRTFAPDAQLRDWPMYALERAVNLNEAQDLLYVRNAIGRMEAKPVLIVIDTFSKFSAGIDENDNGEVSAYLAGLSASIRDEFKATVLLVVHTGHSETGRPRGASALMANPDAEYIVNRASPMSKIVTVTRDRFKDSPPLPQLAYEGNVVDLARVDKRGEAVTSLAFSRTDAPAVPAKAGGKNQDKAMVALREFHRANPTVRHLNSEDLSGLLKAQGINRHRKAEVLNWLVNAGVLTAAVGGHTFTPDNL